MRSLLILPLLSLATPGLAQTYPMPSPIPLPPRMMDPALPSQLSRIAGALTHSFMNIPVGELEAAIEGRPAYPADRRKTVGSEISRDNPYVEQDIQREVASTTSAVQSSARAMQRAMPAIQQAIGQAAATIERETANLPSPNPPYR